MACSDVVAGSSRVARVRRGAAWLIWILAWPGGCQKAPVPSSASEATVVELTSRETSTDGPVPLTAAPRPEGGLMVSGTIETPDPCFDLSARLDAGSPTATLRIVARSRDTPCIQVIGSFDFEAAVGGLPQGATHLEVRFEYPDTGWDPQAVRLDLPNALP